MRLKPEIRTFIKELALKLFPNAEIYLFGSRIDNQALGGDIDILILSEQKLDNKKLRLFRLAFYKKFGWQKIDLINFTKDQDTTFKKLILTSAQAI
jgi:predicted nucleotidyltransferase